MAQRSRRANGSTDDIPTLLRDLLAMVVAYVKQETLEPVRGLGRYLGYGAAAAVVGSLGIFLLVLGGVRALQTETGSSLQGNLSWVPYVLAMLVTGVIAVLAVRAAIGAEKARR